MKWHTLAAVALVVLTAVPDSAAGQRPRKWWQAEAVKATLGLTEDQSAAIEEIFQAALPQLRRSMRKLDRREATLSQMIEDMQAGEEEIADQIDLVEAVRSELSKARTLMTYRMHRLLSPSQRKALRELWASERNRDRRRPGRW